MFELTGCYLFVLVHFDLKVKKYQDLGERVVCVSEE